MEGILNNRLASPRSSARPIIPSRDYVYTRRELVRSKPTPVVPEQQLQPVSKQHRYSRVTPVYSSVPKHSINQKHRSRTNVTDFINIAKKASLNSDSQKASRVDLGFTQHIDEVKFLEDNLDTIDLDLMNGVLKVSKTDLVQQFFERTSEDETSDSARTEKKAIRRKLSFKNIRPKHIVRLSVVVLLVGVVTIWSYVLNDSSFASQSANATASLSVLAPPVVDPQLYRPKHITIEKLDVHAAVKPVDVTESGAMGVPKDIWLAGWYVGSALPGGQGATFIDGHATSSRGALFGNLDTLVAGDQIEIERNDGKIITYSVAKVDVVNRNEVNMGEALKPYGTQENGLNIMSCVGKWITAENTMENRVLVYAVQS